MTQVTVFSLLPVKKKYFCFPIKNERIETIHISRNDRY